MTVHRTLATLFLLVVLMSSPAVAAGKRYALVVGVNKYRAGQPLPPLAYTENDADGLAEVLKAGGYNVTLMTRTVSREDGKGDLAPDSAYIRDQLSVVLDNPFLKPEDVVVVAFAGHGVQYEYVENGKKSPRFYFCPADADVRTLKTANEVTERNRLLDLAEIYTALKNCKAGGKLLLVDACRNDPTKPGVSRTLASNTLPALPPPPGGTAAFFSCSANQRAFEDEDLGGGHGVFFHHVIEALGGAADSSTRTRKADGEITLAELSEHVSASTYDHVAKKYRARQAPELKGEFRLSIPLMRLRKGSSRSPMPRPDPVSPPSITTRATGDWPMWGGTKTRNMVSATRGIRTSFAPEEGKGLLWKKPVGSFCQSSPVVADGRVFVGANNGSGYRKEKYPAEVDLGVLLCFDERTGEFLWQLSREKLASGRANDWPLQGIGSTPCVEGDRLYVVTNRAELVCLDTVGFANGNQGMVDERLQDVGDADVVWSLDMIEDLGVYPHKLATSSPVVHGENVYVITSNGVDEGHLEVASPRAPCFVAVNKKTGELVWEDNTPFDGILHGQWSSPAVTELDGRAQILVAGGDGWLYSFDPDGDGEGGGLNLWRFDLNPKESTWLLGGEGTRNSVVSTPVVVGNSVVLAVGQDPDHGNGVGHLYRIALDRYGDVSPTLVVEKGTGKPVDHGVLYDAKIHEIRPNRNSAQIWHFGGVDEDGSVTGRKGAIRFGRTISTVAVSNGLVFAPDLTGYLHCLDFETGKQFWAYDTFAEVRGSPMVADGKVFLGDSEGDLTVFAADKGTVDEDGDRIPTLLETKQSGSDGAIAFPSAIYSTPTITGGKMFVTDRNTLYSIQLTREIP